MSAAAAARAHGACGRCLRRALALAELSPVLDRLAPDRPRLLDALDLEADELVCALGGRRREELLAMLDRMPQGGEHGWPLLAGATCVHEPAALPGDGPAVTVPRALFPRGAPVAIRRRAPVDGLSPRAAREEHRGPRVAVLGGSHATAYGLECARSLGRSLGAAGSVVVARAAAPAGAAALGAALGTGASVIALLDGAADAPAPRAARPLLSRIALAPALAQLPCGAGPGRRWGAPAAELLAVELSHAAVVVEARENLRELAVARRLLGGPRPLAAVPGPITSPWSGGPNALICEGASLARGAGDLLVLLGLSEHPSTGTVEGPVAMPSRLRAMLARVSSGARHPDEIGRPGEDPAAVLAALSELELGGHLGRREDGTYIARGTPG